MKISIQQKIQAGFIAAVVFLILIGGLSWWSLRQNEATFRLVTHSFTVTDQLQDMLTALTEAESSVRAYAITGEDNYLDGYSSNIAAVQNTFDKAKRLTKDNPDQQRRLALLLPLIQAKIGHMNSVVAMGRRGNEIGSAELIASGKGYETMKQIRQIISDIE